MSHSFKDQIRSGTQGITIYQQKQEHTFWQTVIYIYIRKRIFDSLIYLIYHFGLGLFHGKRPRTLQALRCQGKVLQDSETASSLAWPSEVTLTKVEKLAAI